MSHAREVAARIARRAITIVLAVSLLVAHPAGAAAPRDQERGDGSAAAIVFSRLQGDPENHEIWSMGSHGGNQQRLTRNILGDLEPAWSPDGTTLAWVQLENATFGPSDIWLMNADGSNKRKLTDHRTDISGPTWSPDGTQLAFTKSQAIWVIDADGSDEHRISPPDRLDFDPAWSPDGTQIAFVSSGRGSYDLFVMNADGSDRHRLVGTVGASELDPAWSPDGRGIAFTGSYTSSGWHVGMMRADGTGRRIVIDPYSLYPAWSPDGSRLAFYACGETDCGLYQSDPQGRRVRELGRRRGYSDIHPDFRDTIPA